MAHVTRVLREIRAWDLGADDWATPAENVRARVKGGQALYDTVWACANRMSNKDVRLGRVERRAGGLRGVARWVDGDTILEIVQVHNQNKGT